MNRVDDNDIEPIEKPDRPDPMAMTVKHIPRVLIIEDNLEIGEVLQGILERMAILAIHEIQGQAGLTRYQELRPDLVLLDIGLPDMLGWKILDAIKESKGHSRKPYIIVITAQGDPANRLMGKLQGVDGYLTKPFTVEEVEQLVREILGQKSGKK